MKRIKKLHNHLNIGFGVMLGISLISHISDKPVSSIDFKMNSPYIQRYPNISYQNLVVFYDQTLLKKVTPHKLSDSKIKVAKSSQTSVCPFPYSKIKIMEATAYYPGAECTGKYAVYGLTYTGKKAGYGLVAVDPSVIPLGTMLYIEGYGKAEAADIGGAIKGNKIDLCFTTYKKAKKYGRQTVKVYILK